MAKAPPKRTVRSAGSKSGPKTGLKPSNSTLVTKTGSKTQAKSGALKRAPRKTAKPPENPLLEPEIIEASESEQSFTPEDSFRNELEAIETSEIDPDQEVLEASLPGSSHRSSAKILNPEALGEKVSTPASKALATTDNVALYLAEIRKYPLLTKEQEHELAVRYRETGDPRAAEILVTSNLRFVVKVAAEYSRFGSKLIDLIQEGNVGLMHAVKEFNPYKGVRLITYAVWWIRGYIQEYLMRQYSLVRIGTTQNQRKLFYRLQKEREALDSLGQEPTIALLAGRLGVSEEEVETMSQRLAGRDVSLDQPLDASGTSAARLLDLESTEGPSVDEVIGHSEELAMLNENIQAIRPKLNEKEIYILEQRILADEPLTLQEIGEHYGTTREAVRQLEARLISKIKAAVASSLGQSKAVRADEEDPS